MAINFPNSPAVNDTFTVGGINFTFTGVKWESAAVVELSSDTTPTLGGNLDGGAKNINNVGVITATGFSGPLTGNVTGNATGLTGNPSIQVTNATVLGNLDVQGTTSTIDTAVTEVDSLNVEGSVGIGTTTPAKKLEVAVGNSVSDGILVKGNSSPLIQIDEGSGVSANFGLDGNGSYFGPTSNHYQVFRTNSVERLRITSTGQSIFHKRNNNADDLLFGYGTSSGIYAGIGGYNSFSTNQLCDLTFWTNGSTGSCAPTERMRITSGGQVFIGKSDQVSHPNMDDFQIGDSTGNRGITISSGTSNFGTVAFGDSADGSGTDRYAGFVEYYHNDDSMRLGTSSAERVRITSAGTLQIGSSATINVQITPNTGLVINDGAIDCYQATTNVAAIPFKIQSDVGGTKVVKASITAGGVISDSKGDVRDIPQSSNSSARTLVATDGGKVVMTTSGGWVIPASVMSQGNTVTLLNGDGATQTINATALNAFYNTSDGANIKANTITLGGASMATIWFSSGTVAYISATNMTVS